MTTELPRERSCETIRVAELGGSVTYLVDLSPEALPAVFKRELERACRAARDAAIAGHRDLVRAFRFKQPDGSYTDLAVTDDDARCWIGAVDRSVGLETTQGLSLCLRLLALIDLLSRASWSRPLFSFARDGVEFHPALLSAAASHPLSQDARFDEEGFRLRLSRMISGFRFEAPLRDGNERMKVAL